MPDPSDDTHTRLLSLFLVDTFRWRCAWANWRVRFSYDNSSEETGFLRVTALIRDRVVPLCQRQAEAIDNVLYLLDIADLKAVFHSYGIIHHGPGQISAIQSRQSYQDACGFAAELGQTFVKRQTPAELDAQTLPDIHWTISGSGLERVAVARVRNCAIRVRLGDAQARLWVVDVNSRAACARFRSRPDAMSKLGVALALRAYDLNAKTASDQADPGRSRPVIARVGAR